MLTVILGRVFCGSVGAGITVLVSILITNLVPIEESAMWRSCVNVAATTKRSLGGPVGGWLADAIGWRWSVYPYANSTSFCEGNAVANKI
jgi:predicted MFS family arabinose efflux permease